jgi:hypothetical protein
MSFSLSHLSFVQSKPYPSNNTINKVIEEKMNNSFVLLKNITLQPFWCKKNLTNLNSEICHMKFSDSSQNHKFSDKMLVNNKCYHGKIMLIIFILQTYILIII